MVERYSSKFSTRLAVVDEHQAEFTQNEQSPFTRWSMAPGLTVAKYAAQLDEKLLRRIFGVAETKGVPLSTINEVAIAGYNPFREFKKLRFRQPASGSWPYNTDQSFFERNLPLLGMQKAVRHAVDNGLLEEWFIEENTLSENLAEALRGELLRFVGEDLDLGEREEFHSYQEAVR